MYLLECMATSHSSSSNVAKHGFDIKLLRCQVAEGLVAAIPSCNPPAFDVEFDVDKLRIMRGLSADKRLVTASVTASPSGILMLQCCLIRIRDHNFMGILFQYRLKSKHA